MRRFFLFPLIVVILLVAAAFERQVRNDNHVILVSIDGFEPDYYLHPGEPGVTLPNIESLRDSGSYAAGVLVQYPSLTFPSHTSIATGVTPARHGVPVNTIFD